MWHARYDLGTNRGLPENTFRSFYEVNWVAVREVEKGRDCRMTGCPCQKQFAFQFPGSTLRDGCSGVHAGTPC